VTAHETRRRRRHREGETRSVSSPAAQEERQSRVSGQGRLVLQGCRVEEALEPNLGRLRIALEQARLPEEQVRLDRLRRESLRGSEVFESVSWSTSPASRQLRSGSPRRDRITASMRARSRPTISSKAARSPRRAFATRLSTSPSFVNARTGSSIGAAGARRPPPAWPSTPGRSGGRAAGPRRTRDAQGPPPASQESAGSSPGRGEARRHGLHQRGDRRVSPR